MPKALYPRYSPLKYWNLPTFIFLQSITHVDIVKKGMFVINFDIYNDKWPCQHSNELSLFQRFPVQAIWVKFILAFQLRRDDGVAMS